MKKKIRFILSVSSLLFIGSCQSQIDLPLISSVPLNISQGANIMPMSTSTQTKKEISSVGIFPNELTISVNDSSTIYGMVKNIDGTTSKDIYWNVEDKNILSINQEGKLTGLNRGETKVTATAKDNPEKKATINIRVRSTGAFTVTSDETKTFSAVMNDKNEVLAVWLLEKSNYTNISKSTFFAQKLNSKFQPVGSAIKIMEFMPQNQPYTIDSLRLDNEGNFAIAFKNNESYVVKLYENGSSTGKEILIQSNNNKILPVSLALSGNGNIIVLWRDTSLNSYYDSGRKGKIFIGVYNKNGNIVIPEFQIGLSEQIYQKSPKIIIDENDNSYIVSWFSGGTSSKNTEYGNLLYDVFFTKYSKDGEIIVPMTKVKDISDSQYNEYPYSVTIKGDELKFNFGRETSPYFSYIYDLKGNFKEKREIPDPSMQENIFTLPEDTLPKFEYQNHAFYSKRNKNNNYIVLWSEHSYDKFYLKAQIFDKNNKSL